MQKDLEYAFQLVDQKDNQAIKTGQSILNKLRCNIDYPILLLTHMNNCNEFVGKLRAAIELRIWCDNYKNMEEFERNSYNNIIEEVKSNILFAFLSFSDKIQQTILPGIVSLTVVEFPDRWNSLIPGLITYAKRNPQSIKKILELMVEITNKYSYLSRSDPLYHQIIIVCREFQDFLLNLTIHSVSNILKNQNDPSQVKILQAEITLFYNLNYQDLSPEFEDNIPKWMSILKQVMHLPSNNEIFFKCKGVALQSILLYASKYKDDVQEEIKGFSQSIWTLCANASPDPEYDDIVFNALKYFRSLLMWNDMKQFFANNIPNLVSNLILPNLNFTAHYRDLFQEDIDTFISYFFRNSEISTRRAAAIELLQTIVRYYKNFQQFIQDQVQSFVPGSDNANGQYLLLTLVIESATKGFRDIDGVTQLQINSNIIVYCYEQFIKNTLNSIYQNCQQTPKKPIQKQVNILQLLITLRFVFYFRIYLPTQDLNLILKLCCEMSTQSDSLKQILLLVVNAIVTLKHGNFQLYKNIVFYYDHEKLKDIAQNIFNMIGIYESETEQLNASINKLLFSTIKQLKAYNENFYSSHIEPIIKSMLKKTGTFNFASILPLFEAIGYLTYYLCSMKSAKCGDLQKLAHQYFDEMIKSESDILNFCFQILSIFLQFNPGDTNFYENLYNSVIRQENWTQENISIMSSYLQYIAAFISLNNDKIIRDKETYQKILTKLISIDHYQLFYRFLRGIIRITGVEDFSKYGYMHILIKGTDFISKSTEGRKLGLLFVFEVTYDYNAALVIKCMNKVENGYYQKLLLNNQDIIQTMQVISNRKMMFSSICNALATKCFSSTQNEAMVLNLLVENTTGRFKRDYNFTLGNENTAKKDSTYQKLSVFKEIENTNRNISLDQESVLIQTFTILTQNDPSINSMISQKNMDRLKKLYERQQNQNNFQNQNIYNHGN